MRLLLVIIVAALSLFSNRHALDARIFLYNDFSGQIVAFQRTGGNGKVKFQYLDENNYRLILVFPPQGGKYLSEKTKHSTLTKAAYNLKNKTYYYQGEEGYFAVKFSRLKRIEKEDFKAVFKENMPDEEVQIEVAQFQTKRKGGSISVQVNVLTSKQFKKATEKAGNDLSLLSIPGIK